METINKYSKIIIFAFAPILLGALLLYFFVDPMKSVVFPKCPFHYITGLYCPGCGSQRAVHAILHGHIVEGIQYNFLILLLILVLYYDIAIRFIGQIREKSVKNLLHVPSTTNTILIIVLLFWIFRNIPIYPFVFLAP